jgi:hypothetical protein
MLTGFGGDIGFRSSVNRDGGARCARRRWIMRTGFPPLPGLALVRAAPVEHAAGSLVTGLIVATRHIHTNPRDATKFGLEANSFTEMHIDTDEANAGEIEVGAEGATIEDQATIHRAV